MKGNYELICCLNENSVSTINLTLWHQNETRETTKFILRGASDLHFPDIFLPPVWRLEFFLDAVWGGRGGPRSWKKAAGWLPAPGWAGPPPPGVGWGPPQERPWLWRSYSFSAAHAEGLRWRLLGARFASFVSRSAPIAVKPVR